MPKKSKTIKVDRDTYELMRKLHLLPLDVNVEITLRKKEKEDEQT